MDEPTPEQIKEAFENWLNHFANIVLIGRPFFNGENFETEFRTEHEIFKVEITAKLNNVIPFPEKKKLPPRI